MITVIFVKNPFEPQKNREIHQLPYVAGAPVSHYVQKCTDMLSLSDMVISRNSYTINGNQAVHDRDFIVFSPVVGKGHGKNPLLIIATVALSVVSMGVGGLVASGTWGGAALASATGFAAIGGYLAAAAVMFIGGTLIQRAFGTANTRGYQDNSENPTYSWSGIQTTSGQNNPIPITYGTVRSGGQTIGKYITSDSDKQYLNWLVAAGYGPLKIYDVQLNDNPIENYKNVRLDTRSGLNDQDIIPNFNDTVSTKSLGYELLESEWRTDLVTGNATQGLIIYVECSNGLYYANDNGGLDETFVKIAAQYAPEGSNDWKDFLRPHHYLESKCKYVSLNDDTAPIGEYDIKFESHDSGASYKISIGSYSTTYTTKPERTIAVGPFNWITTHEFAHWLTRFYGKVYVRPTKESADDGMIKGNKSSAIRRQYRVDHLPEGQYQVRVKVVSRGYPVTSTRASTRIWWTAVSGIVYDDFTYPGIALIGVRALATDQLSGSPSMKFMKQRSTVYVWNPGTQAYEEQAATNPAWAAYDMIHRAEKITDVRSGGTTYIHSGADASLLLYNQFAEWAAYCDRFKLKINIEINTSGELLDVVNRFIAPVGRGMVELFGTKYGCCWDGPKEAVQMFGMGNIISGTFSETFLQTSDRANAVELTFTNAQKDYQRDTMKVFGPTFDSDEYDTTSQLTYDGITDYEQAYREAKFQLYCNAYMVRTVSFQAAIDAIACTVGDVIYVAHDVPMWQTSGRIASVDGNTVVVNAIMKSYDGAKTYTFAYRSATDDTRYEVGCQSITVNDATTTVVLSETPTSAPVAGDIFDIAEVNKGTKKFVVRSISRTEDMVREIEAIEYNENVFNENYTIPPMNYSDSEIDTSDVQNVTDLVGHQIHWTDNSGQIHARMYLSWSYPERLPYQRFVISLSRDGGKTFEAAGSSIGMHFECETDVDTEYYVRVVTVNNLKCSTGATIEVAVPAVASAVAPNDISAYAQYRMLLDGTPRYDINVSWMPDNLLARVYYKPNHVQADQLTIVEGVAADNLGWLGPWTYAGTGVNQLIIPQCVPGDTYRIAICTANGLGQFTLPDAATTIDVLCAARTTTPNTPGKLAVAFGKSTATLTWDAVTNADIAFYEIRTDTGVGTKTNGFLLRTNSLIADVELTNRSGKLYVFACGTDGKYSAAAELQYYKPEPKKPDAPTVTDKLGGMSIVAGAIPDDCNGMYVKINDTVLFTANNALTYSCPAGIYDVSVAYSDLFGVGPQSPATRCVVKALVDSSLLADQAVTRKKVDQVIDKAVQDTQTTLPQQIQAAAASAANDLSAVITELNKAPGDSSYKSISNLKTTTDGLTSTFATQKASQDKVNSSVDTQISQIKQDASSLSSTVSANKASQDKVNSSVDTQISQIKQDATSLSSTVSSNKTAQDKVNSSLTSKITQTSDAVTTVVSNLNDSAKAKSYSAIAQMSNAIATKITQGDMTSYLQQDHTGFYIKGSLVNIDGTTKIGNNIITNNMIQSNAVTAEKINVNSLSAITATIGTLRTKASGARVEIKDNLIEVYDDKNILRLRLGVW